MLAQFVGFLMNTHVFILVSKHETDTSILHFKPIKFSDSFIALVSVRGNFNLDLSLITVVSKKRLNYNWLYSAY